MDVASDMNGQININGTVGDNAYTTDEQNLGMFNFGYLGGIPDESALSSLGAEQGAPMQMTVQGMPGIHPTLQQPDISQQTHLGAQPMSAQQQQNVMAYLQNQLFMSGTTPWGLNGTTTASAMAGGASMIEQGSFMAQLAAFEPQEGQQGTLDTSLGQSNMQVMQHVQQQAPAQVMPPPLLAQQPQLSENLPPKSASPAASNTSALSMAVLPSKGALAATDEGSLEANPGTRRQSIVSSSPALSTATRPSPGRQVRRKPMARPQGGTQPAAVAKAQTMGAVPRKTTEPTQTPSGNKDQPTGQVLSGAAEKQMTRVVGGGLERLLAFHSVLSAKPSGSTRGLEFWQRTVKENFSVGGSLRLDHSQQSYDVPAATAGRFYHRMFSEGAVESMHVALGQVAVHGMPASAAIASFHDVLLTTTYFSGRRVLESGALRVIFDRDLRIRLWAFEAVEATACLSRKRSAPADEMPTRTVDVSIARHLDWPRAVPPPQRRRKSAHGRLPADESVLPACALRHLEVASTVCLMQDLFRIHVRQPHGVDVLATWRATANPSAFSQSPRPTLPDRKRQRRKSVPPALAPKDHPSVSRKNAASPKHTVKSNLTRPPAAPLPLQQQKQRQPQKQRQLMPTT
ncbi:hypothetical protein H4S08_000562 [Coemansia sp. RSA 1365]|nr:hypothetical protein H4S08_000562 [Coemansia sp. RSA 1365]